MRKQFFNDNLAGFFDLIKVLLFFYIFQINLNWANTSVELLPCYSHVQEVFLKSNPPINWKKTFYSKEYNSFESPTKDLGVWWNLKYIIHSKEMNFSRETEHSLIFHSVDKDCKISSKIFHRQFFKSDILQAFTDEKLLQLKKKSSYFIYSWSPFMPYSVRGLFEIIKEVESGQFPWEFIPVLDFSVTKKELNLFLEKNKLSKKYIYAMKSFELQKQGISNHFSSAIFLKKGKFVSHLIPGYKPIRWYLDYFKKRVD